jgi:hypothetical protein
LSSLSLSTCTLYILTPNLSLRIFFLFPCTVCQNLLTPLDLSEYFPLFPCQ